ncbi:hypothetical protein BgiMline_004257 [Biomphalaria glabrata]|uniref:Uncharacterized protein LOC106068065 n=1 Tax=Biomphalaria glabrata TaxID=6526 RepID=A0A9W2ZRM4_BIOGL|nr:uncharacterized protein LOC106068065 [Biomphalaria glabrata]XP_055877662.1 uncharacterized protein LOC106068065 [Biomphalaria glabrata]KAI8731596.1 hypothetical protein BgiMline_030497 [Biomphalaria glabrata]
MKPNSWVNLTLALTLFATVLQIAGLVSPLWIWLHTSDYKVGVGLYYRIGCGDGDRGNCSLIKTPLPFSYDADATYHRDEWDAIVWLESIASGLAVLLSIMMLVFRIGFGVWKKMSNLNLTMIITTFFLCSTLAAGLIVYIVHHGKVITRSPDISTESFPWSALMCFIAFFLFLVVAAMVHFKCRATRYVDNAIPSSADSKLALNPSTKNQLMRRYFTPSPYREDRRQALSVYSHTDQSFLLGKGTASSRGIDSYGVHNGGLKAIEFNKDKLVSEEIDYHYTPVIHTSTLTTGVTSGESVRNSFTNNNLTIPDGGNYGSRVVQRTSVTTTTGGESTRVNNVYQEDAEAYKRRQEEQHQQWDVLQAQAAERRRSQETRRIVGKETYLRENQRDAFSDIDLDDAVTIYYTGKDEKRSSGMKDVYTTIIRTDQTSQQRGHINEGYGTQGALAKQVITMHVQPPTPPPPPQSDVTREMVYSEQASVSRASNLSHFRVPADHGVQEGIQQANIKTVHIRPQSQEKVVMAPGHLSGDKFKYNGTYIYRAYSEDMY